MKADVDTIMKWEDGKLELDEQIELFQALIDSGTVWQLQGAYRQTAKAMIKAGYCTLPKKKKQGKN